MTAAKTIDLLSPEEYLAAEARAKRKHEYVEGRIYAMAGTSNRHGRIVVNLLATLHSQLRGKPCEPIGTDTKVRIRFPTHVRFYYPDAGVVCEPNPESDTFHDRPIALFEILSPSTRRLDEGEKMDGYLALPSLQVYALVEQDVDAVVVHRRTADGFVRETYQGLKATIPLPEIDAELPLAAIYERVEFGGEPVADAEIDDF